MHSCISFSCCLTLAMRHRRRLIGDLPHRRALQNGTQSGAAAGPAAYAAPAGAPHIADQADPISHEPSFLYATPLHLAAYFGHLLVSSASTRLYSVAKSHQDISRRLWSPRPGRYLRRVSQHRLPSVPRPPRLPVQTGMDLRWPQCPAGGGGAAAFARLRPAGEDGAGADGAPPGGAPRACLRLRAPGARSRRRAAGRGGPDAAHRPALRGGARPRRRRPGALGPRLQRRPRRRVRVHRCASLGGQAGLSCDVSEHGVWYLFSLDI